MPEGDTVWQTARRLHSALAGRTLTRADLRVPRFATADLTGRMLLDVTPRGKHLLARIEGGLTLHSHLRMDGAWRVYATGTRPHGGPDHQIRAILGNTDNTAYGYRLPVLELIRTADEPDTVGHLGPDLLAPDWGTTTAEEATRRLTADPARTLGEALLDQRNLAGIGNVYKSELAFLAGVTPWLPVGDLEPEVPARLVATAHRLLDANKDRPDRRTTTTRRPRTPLHVYGRAGRPCLRCGAPIRKAELGDRVTYWCPGCQRGPVGAPPAPDPSDPSDPPAPTD